MDYKERRLVIFLADLTHTGIRVATENIPLNIGLIAAYILKKIGFSKVQLKLFKYPDKLFHALKYDKCDILACSSYIWNNNLSEWAFESAKKYNPRVITVRGGWNFPLLEKQQEDYLRKHKFTDIICMHEGENSFLNVVERLLGIENREKWNYKPLGGCAFINVKKHGGLVKGNILPRIKNLEEIPSPYTTGLLDEFFDGNLTPIMETTRGCPFKCNYCNNADDYYNQVNFFPIKYVVEDISYISKKIAPLGVKNLYLADTNFGMYPRDRDIAIALREAQEKYKWPLWITVSTGKSNIKSIIERINVLSNTLTISMSVQSLNPDTLKIINRNNMEFDAYKIINKELSKENVPQLAEVIAPLPNETYASYMAGIDKLLEMGTRKVCSYTLQVNLGTVYKNEDFKKQFGYVNKFRIIPYDFGIYDGQKIFDYEEVGVSTNTLSFKDYLEIRKLALLMELLFNDSVFSEAFKFLNESNITQMKFLEFVLRQLDKAPENVKGIFTSFISDTISELKDTQGALVDFYSEEKNYEELKTGEIGGNVIFKHKGLMLNECLIDWIEYISNCANNIVLYVDRNKEQIKQKIDNIRCFVAAKLSGLFNPEQTKEDIILNFNYDLLSWLNEKPALTLDKFKGQNEVFQYMFYYDENQKKERNEFFLRYGNSISGLSKIMTKVTLEHMFRKVRRV